MPRERRKAHRAAAPSKRSSTVAMQPIRVLTGVRLDATAIAAAPAEKPLTWVQIATEGKYRGYRSGPIEFTRDYFGQVIKNFRATPGYKTGPDGRGVEDLVRYDFDHGSEDGDVDQVVGEPAAAWAVELEMRDGADGKAELWALTRFLEPARSYCIEGKYHWTSVAIWPQAIDPVSGKSIGPLLTSIALTNDPFIRGMQPIQIAASMHYCDKARNPEDALNQIRDLFGLPQLTDVAAVQAEVGKLKAALDAGALPPGVDGDDLIGGLKTILGLPVLAGADEVFAELVKLVPALAEHQEQELAEGAGAASNVQGGAPAPTMASRKMATRQEALRMDPKNRVKLARIYGVADEASDEAILLAAEKAEKDGADAKTKLGALLKALGVEDSDGAIGKLTDMMGKVKELEAAMPELANLKAEKAEVTAKQEEKDVDEAIAAHRLGDNVRDALVLFRRSDPKKFAEKYPKAKAGEAHLTKTLFTSSNGAPIGSRETGAVGADGRVLANNTPGSGARVMLSANFGVDEQTLEQAEGRNVTEKAISLIRCHMPGGDKMTFDQVHEHASRLVAQLRRTT